MSTIVALSVLVAAAISGAHAQTTTTVAPLADQTYAYSALPYQVEPIGDIRGNQVGYNRCNSSTETQDSLCQTLIVNTIDDFCLWSSPKENDTIGVSEAYEVAWCAKHGHGTRIMPAGTLQDPGQPRRLRLRSELDPHGADELGNPMGGVVYSNQYPSGNTDNSSLSQVIEWNEFIGNNQFCIKICNPSETTPTNVGLCNNVYDEVGISYNCPNSAQKGVFEVCDGDSMTPIGQYVSDGVTTTWTQPWSGTWTVPYTPTVPASSNCRTYASTDLYTSNSLPTSSASGSGSASGASATGSGAKASGSGASASGSSAGASATGTSGNSSGAHHVIVSGLATVLGVGAALAFLA
ncbi:hypothetical protein EVJ58_g7414 [Rhodofomes roseus]|uniref:Macrofage activating glycoprotein n=1 Tax=Rhodofomes roseus TaxID=34475 RepID=A0A4Y9Y4T5_9APHY|nr:hypothetical protein EVJ58_g7414 [Rhodofomes roseus]